MTGKADYRAELEKICAQLAGQLAVEVKKIELAKRGRDLLLRIILDKPSGVTIEDCAQFARGLNRILKETDLIREDYYLEVSSPGISKVKEEEEA